MQIFILNFFLVFNFYIFGNFFANKIDHHNILCKFSFSCILGAILISFISLLVNFFFPLNQMIGNLFIGLSLLIFTYSLYLEKNKIKILLYVIILSILSTLLILYSNIYRPDAGLYHLPYIQIIQENKILLGLTNIHFRFGHTSILQYLSAIYNNGLMPIETITLPPSIIVGAFYIYFLSFYDKRLVSLELKIFVSLVTIYTFYSFNRYSNFGNDVISHLFFFLFLIRILQTDLKLKKINDFGNLVIISTFAFMQKVFMIFLPIICFFIFIKFFIRKNIFKNIQIFFPMAFIFLWLIKNIFISGCLVYPINFLCFENLSYLDIQSVKKVEVSSESWAKDWPNRLDNKISMEEFNKNFNWLPTWSVNHLYVILEKFLPFLIFVFLNLCILVILFRRKNMYFNKNFQIKFYILSLITFALSLLWFLKFPIYRYGQSFLASFIILLFCILITKFTDLEKTFNLLKYFSFIIITLVIYKNVLRISEYHNDRNQWPNIYTLSENKNMNFKKELIPIYYKGNFIYYFSDNGECMYNKSPCTNLSLGKIKRENKNSYVLFLED